MRGLRAAAATVVLAAGLTAGLTAGCARDGGSADKAPSSSATPSGFSEMRKKVDAAESAVAKADREGSQDESR